MKTKIYLSLAIISTLLAPNLVSANWYTGYDVAKGAWKTQCNSDAFPDVAPTIPGIFTGSTAVYFTGGMQARVSADLGASIRCQYWDSTIPTASASNSSVTWINNTIPIVLSAADTGWSGLTPTSSKYIWNYNNVNPAGLYTSAYCLANGTSYANGDSINLTSANQGDHTLYVCTQDVATNKSAVTSWIYRIDTVNPIASNLTYANVAQNGWQTSTSIVLNWNGSDPAPGSGIKNYDVRIYSSVTPQSPVWGAPIVVTTPSSAPTYTYTGLNGYAYKFEICARDIAGNMCTTWLTTATTPDYARIDNVAPDPAGLVNSTALNLVANTAQAFTYLHNDGGAPVSITAQFEDFSNPAATLPVTNTPTYGYNFTSTQNISLVDSDRFADGNTARQYSYNISNTCDQAGNCNPGVRVFNYNVYANPNSAWTNLVQDMASLTNAVADGQPRGFNQTLKDGYGNIIIPAAGINRIVNLNLTGISNTMFLDQYNRSGLTSVYLGPSQVGLWFGASQGLGAQTSTNGNYPLDLRVYAPTANSYLPGAMVSDPLAGFAFATQISITDTIWAAVTLNSPSTTFNFLPLFVSKIKGDLLNGGFIEWAEQNSPIDITKNSNASWLAVISSPVLQMQFGWTNSANFAFYANSSSPVSSIFATGVKTNFTVSPWFPTIWAPIYSQLVQNPAVVSNTSNLYLSTHLSYTLNLKPVITNSDVIGKTGWFFGTDTSVGNQVGVKLLWAVSSKNINALVTGQFATWVSMFSNINRSTIRESVKKNVAIATRNATLIANKSTNIVDEGNIPPAWGTASGLIIGAGTSKSIMLIQWAGGNITLSAGSISGIRTIVVRWANLYINQNMYYTDKDSILGVVVQKDASGNGGNLYISPTITNVVGTYILDGSVISYNGTTELGYGTPITTLNNQLHIYGSIVSENTIGWSRLSPPVCPSLINITCTTSSAQAYDLNYLRRYYLTGTPIEPFGWGHTIGNETCILGACTTTANSLIHRFNSVTADLAQYPTIIEYNPNIQAIQPIGFDNAQQ